MKKLIERMKRRKKMRRFVENLKIFLVILSTLIVVFCFGFIKYKVWRAEHPQAKTWTFFIPKNK